MDLVGSLSNGGEGAGGVPTVDECLGFVALFFDQNNDGQISRTEVRSKIIFFKFTNRGYPEPI